MTGKIHSGKIHWAWAALSKLHLWLVIRQISAIYLLQFPCSSPSSGEAAAGHGSKLACWELPGIPSLWHSCAGRQPSTRGGWRGGSSWPFWKSSCLQHLSQELPGQRALLVRECGLPGAVKCVFPKQHRYNLYGLKWVLYRKLNACDRDKQSSETS